MSFIHFASANYIIYILFIVSIEIIGKKQNVKPMPHVMKVVARVALILFFRSWMMPC